MGESTQSDSRIVLGVGELLWDCFPNTRKPGGAPANVAFHVQQLGWQGHVLSRVGDDPLGRELLQFLDDHALLATDIQIDKTHPTGRVDVELTTPTTPKYHIHQNVAWDYLELSEHWLSLAKSARAISFGSLAQRSPKSRETIRRILEAAPADARRVFDINVRPMDYPPDLVSDSLRMANILKLNEDEVKLVADQTRIKFDNMQSFAETIITQFELDCVCITRAERGCQLISKTETADIEGKPVQVADAVGAGDAFTAGLIDGILRGQSIESAGRLANALGALVASHSGAMPKLTDKIEELRANIN